MTEMQHLASSYWCHASRHIFCKHGQKQPTRICCTVCLWMLCVPLLARCAYRAVIQQSPKNGRHTYCHCRRHPIQNVSSGQCVLLCMWWELTLAIDLVVKCTFFMPASRDSTDSSKVGQRKVHWTNTSMLLSSFMAFTRYGTASFGFLT
jgi:hypothetical protein